MSQLEVPIAVRALGEILARLEAAGIEASDDPSSFYPQPSGVLVGLPTFTGRGHAFRTFEIPVLVVSGDPLSSPLQRDRLYAIADDVALVLACDNYRPSSYRSSSNAEPLPAVELTVVISTIETPEV